MRLARLQRDAFESVDKAWAARTITSESDCRARPPGGRGPQSDRRLRQGIRTRTAVADRSAQCPKSAVQRPRLARVHPRGVAMFGDYQLLAAMGQLLSYLKTTHPIDAEPLEPQSPSCSFHWPTSADLDRPAASPAARNPSTCAKGRSPLADPGNPMVPPPPRRGRQFLRDGRARTVGWTQRSFARWMPESRPRARICFRSLGLGILLRGGDHARAPVADQGRPLNSGLLLLKRYHRNAVVSAPPRH